MKNMPRRVLADVFYATVATSDNAGNPWNSPVFYAHDNQGRIYWSSHPESVHSRNIAYSKKAFIVIYNSMAREGEGVGLYMDVSVEVLEGKEEVIAALQLLGERRGKPFHYHEKFLGDGPQRIYRATPRKCWVNDAEQDSDGDFIKDFRVDVSL
jgi:hypothetical protein